METERISLRDVRTISKDKKWLFWKSELTLHLIGLSPKIISQKNNSSMSSIPLLVYKIKVLYWILLKDYFLPGVIHKDSAVL